MQGPHTQITNTCLQNRNGQTQMWCDPPRRAEGTTLNMVISNHKILKFIGAEFLSMALSVLGQWAKAQGPLGNPECIYHCRWPTHPRCKTERRGVPTLPGFEVCTLPMVEHFEKDFQNRECQESVGCERSPFRHSSFPYVCV